MTIQNHTGSAACNMTTQNHTGAGDNVRDKYENIMHSIQTRDLKSVVDSLMSDICYRDLIKAEDILNTLSDIGSLESEVRSLLSVIQVKVDLVKGSSPSAKQELLILLRNTKLPQDIHDVVTSILIDLESRTALTSARERYDGIGSDNVYINEVFFERLASKEEIQYEFGSPKRLDFLEQELAGLARGALRVGEFKLGVEITHLLKEHFPSKNANTLSLYCESCLSFTVNERQHYFSIEKQNKDIVDRLVNELLGQIGEDDTRYIAILINLLHVTFFLEQKLVEQGHIHIEKVRNMDANCADTIESMFSDLPPPDADFELTPEPIDLVGFSKLHFAIDNDLVKHTAVNSWLDSGGGIHTGDNYLNSFTELVLAALLCSTDDRKAIQLLRDKANKVLKLDSKRLISLNPFLVIKLCKIFIELNLPLYAIKYLNPFIPNKPWVSPIFECYLSALYESEKYDLFLARVEHLTSADKTELIWVREAHIYEITNEYELSLQSITTATQLAPSNSYNWYFLLFVLRSSKTPLDSIKKVVFEIPKDIFSTYHESKMPLINEISVYVDTHLAERILIDWFVQAPDKVAIPLTQVHFNSLHTLPKVTENPYIPEHCGDGVTYTDGFDTFKRILVKDIDVRHSNLLDINSPTGQLIKDLNVGESISSIGLGDITLLERLPPYMAAFRLASELRHKGNDGNDVFKMLTLPSNDEDIFPYMEKVMKLFSHKDKDQNSALKNPNIPLVMRGDFTDPSSPISGAIKHLTSKDSTQYLHLFNEGIENPNKVIIDIYTAVYFAISGLAKTLSELPIKIILSQQTKHNLELWINDITREDYLSLDLTEHGIRRLTSEDIKRNSQNLIQGLQTILDDSSVETLKPFDTPDNLLKIKDVMDGTVYSTFQLAVANEIPWLCVDHIMCNVSHGSGYHVVNIYSVLMGLLNGSSLENKRVGIELNLLFGTPMPILYNDIAELSQSINDNDVYLVVMFLKKYNASFESPEECLGYLTELAGRVTVNASMNNDFINGGVHNPRYDGYAEHVFNLCCRSALSIVGGETAEKRLALLISNLFLIFGYSHKYKRLIIRLASDFANGHFLNIKEVSRAFTTYLLKDE